MADSQTKHVSFEQIFIYIKSENLDKLSKERRSIIAMLTKN